MARFRLASSTRQHSPKMHCLMLSPGTHRVTLVRDGDYTAWANVDAHQQPKYWTTEFYAFHHAHDNPTNVKVYSFLGQRAATVDDAFANFVPSDIIIDGSYPLPVMFCVADAQDKDNIGGLTVQVN